MYYILNSNKHTFILNLLNGNILSTVGEAYFLKKKKAFDVCFKEQKIYLMSYGLYLQLSDSL